jgi:peroxiredoxin
MVTPHNPLVLPTDLPAPQDDGAARHLTGLALPDLPLPATNGAAVNLAKLRGRTVVYAYQREAVERLHLPFAILSDAELKLTRALRLPTFSAGGMTLLKRLTLVIDDGRIAKVFYPVFPPDKNADEVIAWLRSSR